jgi:hypothetical protein
MADERRWKCVRRVSPYSTVDSITVAVATYYIRDFRFVSGYVIYKGSHDQHHADNTSNQLVLASCASPSRDNLSHRGQWFTLVVKHARVVQSRKCTSQTLFDLPVPGHSHNMPNIALWSSLPLLLYSPL